MNILIFNWRDIKHSWAGGSEIYIFEMAKRWVKEGNKVTLFCSQDIERHLPEFEIINGVQVHRKGNRFTVYIWAILYYLFKLRKFADTVVDVENGVPFFTPLYSRKPKICLVYHVHGKQFFYELLFPLNLIGFIIEKYLFPLFYFSTPIIAISKTTKEALIKLGFSDKKIVIVYAGAENKNSHRNIKKFLKPTILYLGRIKKYKRVDFLIKILPKILVKVPNARLLIAGWGSEAPFISDIIMKSKVRKNIKIIGPVTEALKEDLLARSWVFVNASIHEGWGVSIIEANLARTPAVSFDVPGLSDSIRHYKTGFLCKDEDDFVEKICLLLKDSMLRENLSNNARKWGLSFDWQKTASKSLKILQQL